MEKSRLFLIVFSYTYSTHTEIIVLFIMLICLQSL